MVLFLGLAILFILMVLGYGTPYTGLILNT